MISRGLIGAAVIALVIDLFGCGAAPKAESGKPIAAPQQPAGAAAAPGDAAASGIMALVDGRAVRWSELRPLLVEAAGADVLSEWLLDRRLEAELRDKNLTVTDADIDAEKQLMLRQLNTNPDDAIRLLQNLRDERGLGDHRFPALLRRNASLRKLVSPQVNITDAMVQQAYRQRYGEKTVVRMILVPTLGEASAVARRLAAGENFTDLAIALSKDSSRDQGGLLPAISAEDPTFPEIVRQTVSRMVVGQVSDPVAIDQAFAILRCERKITQEQVPFDKVAGDLRQLVRLRAERSLMQRQARVLLEKVDITVLDAELDRDWKRSRTKIVNPNGK